MFQCVLSYLVQFVYIRTQTKAIKVTKKVLLKHLVVQNPQSPISGHGSTRCLLIAHSAPTVRRPTPSSQRNAAAALRRGTTSCCERWTKHMHVGIGLGRL